MRTDNTGTTSTTTTATGNITLLEAMCRRICLCHFEPQYETRSNRLSPAAVPTLYLQGDASDTAVDFPLQEYSHPLCTENQDEFPSSVISTGDND
ncbi:unnamed protein product, partial [Iphiclides podalirius]